MYRHFRLTPYTNHYKYSAFQDSRLEFVSLFPRVDTRLIPTNVLHATYLRYLHIIYMLNTILKHTTNISCKSTPLHRNIPYTQHTKHTPSSSIHFFIYYYYYYIIIIFYLFFLLPSFLHNHTTTLNDTQTTLSHQYPSLTSAQDTQHTHHPTLMFKQSLSHPFYTQTPCSINAICTYIDSSYLTAATIPSTINQSPNRQLPKDMLSSILKDVRDQRRRGGIIRYIRIFISLQALK